VYGPGSPKDGDPLSRCSRRHLLACHSERSEEPPHLLLHLHLFLHLFLLLHLLLHLPSQFAVVFSVAVVLAFFVVIPEGDLLLLFSPSYNRPGAPSIAHFAMGGM
jgi:hypothetical protein